MKKFLNGDKYDGEWKDGKMHGKGVYTYINGDQYEGEYSDNVINGSGNNLKRSRRVLLL